jgi:hypothetical protein
MEYQIVLQFAATAIADFDRLIVIEEELANSLEGFADVDGNDFGSGEMNIFIIATRPVETFSKIKELMDRRGLLSSLKAAYRKMDEDDFIILWPPTLMEFKVI